MRRAHFVDQCLHHGIRLEQFREHRQQAIAHVADPSSGDLEIEHAQEFSIRAGIGDERGTAGVGYGYRLRNGVVGMAAENDVDARDAARKLEIDIHAVMRQQHHGIGLVVVAQRLDQFLQFVVPNTERPVRREAFRVRDRHIRKCLPDHGHLVAADLLERGRLEDASRRRIEGFGVVERGFL